MNNYFIITNLNGNDLGEYGWIVEHDSEKHLNEGDMIEAAEYFSGTGSTALVHRKDIGDYWRTIPCTKRTD